MLGRFIYCTSSFYMILSYFTLFYFILFYVMLFYYFFLVVFLLNNSIIHLSSFFITNCRMPTNRKQNYKHASVLPFIFVSCSLTIEKVGRLSFPEINILFYISFYFNLLYCISFTT